MKKKVIYIICAVLVATTVVGLIKSIFIGLDIDESYSIALAYRLINGDKLVNDMWEPHQFSAIFTAVFLIPFSAITGSFEYVVIFVRIVSIVIHCGLGFFLYKSLVDRYSVNKIAALVITLIHINFLPRWIQSTEFALVTYWCLLAVFILLSEYFLSKKRNIWLFAAGIALGFSVLCYPTMILVCVYICIAFLICSDKKINVLYIVAGTAIVGAVQVGVLLANMSVKELIHYIPYIFMDASHTSTSFGTKWIKYGAQFIDGISVIGLVLAIGSVIGLTVKLIRKQKLSFVTILSEGFLYGEMILCVVALWGMIFGNQCQFYMQLRYVLPILTAFTVMIAAKKEKKNAEDKICIYMGIVPGILCFAATLFVTNLDINSTLANLFCSTLAALTILSKKFNKSVIYEFAMISLLVVSLTCRVIMLRVTGCVPVTVKASMSRMEKGAEKGIYCLDSYCEVWSYIYDNLGASLVEAGYGKDSEILFVSAEMLPYIYFDMDIASPSVLDTAVFNEMFLEYYREHPEKIPDIVVFDASFEANPNYVYSAENEVLKDWVRNNYRKDNDLSSFYCDVYVK